mmetsp:Transcript_14953/g.24739  ORF Transcript_14953/g.24739 Transcript_14953/m.24739 type:complete len:202 (-) Transcript_14953:129-734(-)
MAEANLLARSACLHSRKQKIIGNLLLVTEMPSPRLVEVSRHLPSCALILTPALRYLLQELRRMPFELLIHALLILLICLAIAEASPCHWLILMSTCSVGVLTGTLVHSPTKIPLTWEHQFQDEKSIHVPASRMKSTSYGDLTFMTTAGYTSMFLTIVLKEHLLLESSIHRGLWAVISSCLEARVGALSPPLRITYLTTCGN